MKISIAMATYNGSKYISEQLDSIVQQTVQPYEMVICDDGSSDDTVEIIRKFSKLVSFPVHIYENEKNLGYADNFLTAASLCTGDWISFCDQDDVWFPHKLEKIEKIIYEKADDDLLLIAHSADKTTDNLDLLGIRGPDFKKSKLIEKNQHYGFWVIPGFACTVRQRLIVDFHCKERPRDFNSGKKQAHDIWIFMLANALGNIYVIDESLVFWRRHQEASTLTKHTLKAHTIKDKIKNSQNFGSKLYNFRAQVANESATILKLLAEDHKERHKVYNSFKETSILFEKLSKSLSLRSELYSTIGIFYRMNIFFKMLFSGVYFGKKFYSLGWKSFLKDIYYMTFN